MTTKQDIISKCTNGIVVDADNLDGVYEVYDASKLFDLAYNAGFNDCLHKYASKDSDEEFNV